MIYFIQAGEGRGPIKVGLVEDAGTIWDRLRTLQTGNADRLHLIAFLPGGLPRERELHARFAEGHLSGEWFRWDTPGLQEVITEALELEAEQLGSDARYCAWCKRNLVRPPRTRLCSDACERAERRATSKAWKASRR